MRHALEQLIPLTQEEGSSMTAEGKEVIAKVIKDYIMEEDMVHSGLQILNNLSISSNTNDVLFCKEIIAVVPLAMKVCLY